MKSVGQQLQEARLAKNWTPELAARETKIKADRVRDLEADDYTNFSSPTYARGFVRTYARALGLDEYKILRQLDNKLPEDDNATFAPDNGMPYVPEPSSQAMHVSSAPRTGLYIVLGLGCAVAAIIAFVLFQAYRAGELPRYFASTAAPDNSAASTGTNAVPFVDTEAPPHALPVDANDTSHSVRALPVDLNAAAATPPDTNAAPASTNVAVTAPAVPAPPIPVAPTPTNAAPVVVASITPPTVPPVPDAAPAIIPTAPAAAPATTAIPSTNSVSAPFDESKAPRALPVDPSELAAADAAPNTSPAAAPTESSLPPTESSLPPTSSARASASTAMSPSADSTPAYSTVAAPIPTAATAVTPPASLPPPPDSAPTVPAVASSPAATPPPADSAAPVPSSADATAPGPVTPVDLGTNATIAPADSHPANKRLVLTASRDSFVRVTSLDPSQPQEILYASVLHAGQSLSFDGRKFSVNVGVPSAVDIVLDGVYYGPHSDGQAPETFTLESHQP